MKITALLENTAARGDVHTEHGLSLYIETGAHTLLFDMGQTALFARNADTLGLDLAAVDAAVLSHGHYDHGGGLRTFLERNKTAPVYLSRHAFEPHYHGAGRYIGLDVSLQEEPRLRFISHETVLGEGLTLYPCLSSARRHPLDSGGLQRQEDGVFLPEDFRHEQYLMIEEAGKRVLFSGCSHRGILDIAACFRPDILVGGFHLSKFALDETLDRYGALLNLLPVEYYTCHCTGIEQYLFLQQRMERLRYLACGQSIQL